MPLGLYGLVLRLMGYKESSCAGGRDPELIHRRTPLLNRGCGSVDIRLFGSKEGPLGVSTTPHLPSYLPLFQSVSEQIF
ncbi:hypothetical protein VC83_06944 [Pseudogymnoascus destructans]|uniref:Uncharacterized protein n=1 Tax=Pseudogymnoascus destructans TaxID=655981 RepID=A0A177A434_9PEZI|nr:uncharacterized protein VC83_06944 [Pseudogymnoascus destructans]OAF56928.1 hypothetical protein VC83_06944 [Pseudogymnoascus destructans]